MTDQPAPAPAPAPAAVTERRLESVTLSTPVIRGDTAISQLTLRKPTAGELRGLNLSEIVSSEITAILTLIPRISNPPLAQHEADALEADDLTEIGGVIRGFFMTRAERETIETLLEQHRPKS